MKRTRISNALSDIEQNDAQRQRNRSTQRMMVLPFCNDLSGSVTFTLGTYLAWEKSASISSFVRSQISSIISEEVQILCRYKDSIPFSSINGEEPCSNVMSSSSKSSMHKPCDDSVENGEIVNIYFDSPLLAFQ